MKKSSNRAKKKQKIKPLILILWFVILLKKWNSKTKETVKLVPSEKSKSLFEKIRVIVELENGFMRTNLSCERIAIELGVCDFEIKEAVKTNTGQIFSLYVDSFRLERAKDLLLNSEKSVQDIRVECGFIVKPTFNRKFKEVNGLTPRDYRKKYQKPKNQYK